MPILPMSHYPYGSVLSNRTRDGTHFKNMGSETMFRTSPVAVLRWQWNRLRHSYPRKPRHGFDAFAAQWFHPCHDVAQRLRERRHADTSRPTSASKHSAGKDYVLWIGHATQLLCLRDGTNILFDPIFSKRASPLSFVGPTRRIPPATALAELPANMHAVCISHNHYDHLDKSSVVQLHTRYPLVQFVVPLGVERYLRAWGIPSAQITSLDWWQECTITGAGNDGGGEIRVIGTPAQHWSLRSGFDRNETLWCGWCVQWRRGASGGLSAVPATTVRDDAGGGGGTVVSAARAIASGAPASVGDDKASAGVGTFYFAGDTAYNAVMFAAIHERFPRIDLAAIPIGAYRPRDFMRQQHIDPQDAVRVCRILQPSRAIGVHWGTFELADESLDEPCAELRDTVGSMRESGVEEAVHFDVIPMGELIEVPE